MCGPAFSGKGILKIHMQTHTGEKQLSCEVCGSAFSKRHYFKKKST